MNEDKFLELPYYTLLRLKLGTLQLSGKKRVWVIYVRT